MFPACDSRSTEWFACQGLTGVFEDTNEQLAAVLHPLFKLGWADDGEHIADITHRLIEKTRQWCCKSRVDQQQWITQLIHFTHPRQKSVMKISSSRNQSFLTSTQWKINGINSSLINHRTWWTASYGTKSLCWYRQIFRKYDTGLVPTDWKTANISPIFKKGSRFSKGPWKIQTSFFNVSNLQINGVYNQRWYGNIFGGRWIAELEATWIHEEKILLN